MILFVDDEDQWDFCGGVVVDFFLYLVVGVIDICLYVCCVQLCDDVVEVIVVLFCYGYVYDLVWCELQWEVVGVVFEEDCEEVFDGFEECLVDYYGLVFLFVGIGVFQFEVVGLVEVQLDG